MMQIVPFWKQKIGRPDDNLIHTPTNRLYSCTFLRYYLDKEKGHLAGAQHVTTVALGDTGMLSVPWELRLKIKSSSIKPNGASPTTRGLVPLTLRFC
jgi:hypothetical protein